MSEQSVQSSDLGRARELSRRLAAGRTPPKAAPEPTPYVRFRKVGGPPVSGKTLAPEQPVPPPAAVSSPPQPRVPTPIPAAPTPAPPKIDVEEFTSWEQFLAWCSFLMRTESAFVVDGQGFIIANHGQLSPQDSDGLGAELSLAMEQLGRIDALALQQGGLQSAELDFGARKVIGFRGILNREEFVLGFVAVEPIPTATRAAVASSFREVLPRLG